MILKLLIETFISRKLVLLMSCAIGFVIILPYLYGYYTFNNQFSPLISNDNLSYLREGTYSYSAQVNQIIKGHLYGDAYVWEYKSGPSPFVGELASIIPIAVLSFFSTIYVLKKPSSKYFYLWPVIIGVSIYSSTFIMSTMLFALALLAPKLYSKIAKQKLLISLFIIILITIPYLINFIFANILYKPKEFLLTFSFEPKIMFPAQIRYLLIALLLFWLRKKDTFSNIIFAFILSAAILMDLHQVFFGRKLQADHYISRILAPMATLSIFIRTFNRIDLLKRNAKIWVFLTLIVLTLGFQQQLSWISLYSNDFKQLTYRKNIIDYINKNTDKNDVIGTLNPDVNDEIQANTGRWVYIAPGDRTFVAHNEQLTRICDLAILLNKKENDPEVKRAVYYSLALES